MKCLTYLGSLAAALLVPSAGNAAWQVAQSDHFTIYADQSPESVHDFADRLERFDAALRALFGLEDAGPIDSRRVTIFVLEDQDDIKRIYSNKSNSVAGFYLARSSGSVAFIPRHMNDPLNEKLNPQQVLLHEYTHHFTYLHWPENANPPWFIEGFAEFAATAEFGKDGSVTIGAPPEYRAEAILDPSISFEQLLISTPQKLNGQDNETLYGRGWLLTHMLLLSPDRRGQYLAYSAALKAGKPPLEAAKSAFGDLKKLRSQMERYALGNLHTAVIGASTLKIGPIQVTPLSPGAAAMMPVMIQTWRGVRKNDATGVAERARKLAAPFPNDPAVFEALAEADYDADDMHGAMVAASRAAMLDPHNARARIVQGEAAMAMAQTDHSTDPARWNQVRAYFIAANKLDTNNAEALRQYFQSYPAAGQQPTPNAQTALLRAYELAPFDGGLRFIAANILLLRGDTGRAHAALASIAYDPHGGRMSERAARIITALDTGGAAAAIAALDDPKSSGGDE